MIVIDGSFGEGGGQILRTSIALSAILGEPIKITNIRAKRPQPGLKRQHITAITAAATICNAEVEGLKLGSTTVVFKPKNIKSGTFRFDIGTAGSISLVLQTLLPIMAYAPGPTEVIVSGGTDVPWSPPIDYVRTVITYYLKLMGYEVRIELVRRGHYPKGGGEVRVTVEKPPRALSAIELVNRGNIRFIKGRSHCVKLPKHVAERQARSAKELLSRELANTQIEIELEWYEPGSDPHLGPGSGIVLWAGAGRALLGADSLGARGKRAEVVGKEAAMKLLNDLRTGMAFDTHMGDNIIPYVALAEGTSLIGGAKLSMHAYTNIWLVKKILNIEIQHQGSMNEPFKLQVKGAGIKY